MAAAGPVFAMRAIISTNHHSCGIKHLSMNEIAHVYAEKRIVFQ
jgi:hypothetical protein